jgi:histone acetyltransferase
MTYADRTALVFFKKQGFITNHSHIPMQLQQYLNYDGGNIMECHVHPKIDYDEFRKLIAVHKKRIIERMIILEDDEE